MRLFSVPLSEFINAQRADLLARVAWQPKADDTDDAIRQRVLAARRNVKAPDAPALVADKTFVVPGTTGAKIVLTITGDASLARYRAHSGSALSLKSDITDDTATIEFPGKLDRAAFDKILRDVGAGLKALAQDLRASWQPSGWLADHLRELRDGARLARRKSQAERQRLMAAGIPVG